jgi:hypothetical protein
MNQSKFDKNESNKKQPTTIGSIETIAVSDNSSPQKLIDPGRLRLANTKKRRTERSTRSSMMTESM